MIKAAVLGLGTISPLHLAAIQAMPGVMLAAVCDIDPETRKNVSVSVPFYTDYHRLLDEVHPDMVHICLPHYLHVPAAKAAAEHGCHVFCEKPPAMDYEEMEEFIRLEEQYPGQKFTVCFQNRCNKTIQALKPLLDSGEYGKVTGVKGVMLWRRDESYYMEKPWRGQMDRAGGGCLMNQAIHTIDLLSYLGGPIQTVKAQASQLLDYDIDVEDTAVASFRYENGAKGLFVATLANFRDEFLHISVQTEKALFNIDGEVLTRVLPDGTETFLARDERFEGEKSYYGCGHFQLISQFYHAVGTGGDDYIHIREAAESIRFVDAIRRSGGDCPVNIRR